MLQSIKRKVYRYVNMNDNRNYFELLLYFLFERLKFSGVRIMSLRSYRVIAKFYNSLKNRKAIKYRKQNYQSFLTVLKNDNSEAAWQRNKQLKDDGWSLDTTRNFKYLDQLIAECEKLFDSIEPNNDVMVMPYPILDRKEIYQNQAMIDFCFSDEILYIVSNYLGGVPTLLSIDLLRSDPRDNTFEENYLGSQNWHLDNVTRPFIRVFVYINDVDEETGPFAIITKKLTKFIEKKTGYGSFCKSLDLSDEEVNSCVSQNEIVKALGAKGTIVFGDPCSCFHFGSRAKSKPRLVFSLSFCCGPKENFRDSLNLDMHMPFSKTDSDSIRMIKDAKYIPTT